MDDKVFKTHNSQMKILRSRGLIVKTEAKKILQMENYYNVINGYKDLFLDTISITEKYKAGANFKEIYSLYEFDQELRFIFLKQLFKIENNIKSVLAYEFSKEYGFDNYLKLENFNTYGSNRELNAIMSVINTLQRTIATESGKNASVTHYITEYGYVPMWVLVDVLTLGNISKLYRVLKIKDRQSIAKEFGLQQNVLASYLKLMTFFRNACAHGERFYNLKLTTVEITSGTIHRKMGIGRGTNGKYLHGTNDVFALLITIKEFLPKTSRGEFTKLIKQINDEINKLQSKLITISINDVLDEMGFPSNWKTIKMI